MSTDKPGAAGAAVPHGRCVCGHFPSAHMVVRALGGSASFRLDPSGSCSICGEATCRTYTPAGPALPPA